MSCPSPICLTPLHCVLSICPPSVSKSCTLKFPHFHLLIHIPPQVNNLTGRDQARCIGNRGQLIATEWSWLATQAAREARDLADWLLLHVWHILLSFCPMRTSTASPSQGHTPLISLPISLSVFLCSLKALFLFFSLFFLSQPCLFSLNKMSLTTKAVQSNMRMIIA